MKHKIGGSELVVYHQNVAGSEIFVLEVRSKSSLDYSSVVLNLTAAEFDEIVQFLQRCKTNIDS